jgi:hypothetical protein
MTIDDEHHSDAPCDIPRRIARWRLGLGHDIPPLIHLRQ